MFDMMRWCPMLVAAVMVLGAQGCGGSGAEPAGSQAAGKLKIKIKAQEKEVATYKIEGTDIEIEWASAAGSQALEGKLKSSGERKYERGGAPLYEIKYKDDGFKLRKPSGELLWKVKFHADKVKVAADEEMKDSIELVVKEEDTTKVEVGGQEVAKVKFHADTGKIKVKDPAGRELFESNTAKRSVAYGLLVADRIPEEVRHILIAEILARP